MDFIIPFPRYHKDSPKVCVISIVHDQLITEFFGDDERGALVFFCKDRTAIRLYDAKGNHVAYRNQPGGKVHYGSPDIPCMNTIQRFRESGAV